MTSPARHILAVDQGTTNTKVVILDEQGVVRAQASRPLVATFPAPTWVELDATAVTRSVDEAIDEALFRAGDPRLAAVAISNQRESAILWDRATGQPLGPVVTWQCRRTATLCDDLRARGAETLLRARTGLTIDPLFSATKFRWLLDQIPGGRARAQRGELAAGTMDAWVLWHLTAGAAFACDVSNASRTQLLDLERLVWDPDLLSLFELPAAMLPRLVPSSGVVGTTAARGRLPAGVPIAALIGDSHAALFGHGATRPGLVKATYGTGSSLMTPTAGIVRSRAGLSTTVAWQQREATYALEGNVSVTGSGVQWVGELLGLAAEPGGSLGDRVAALAARVPSSDGVYLVPAFVGLGAPHWDTGARGVLAGLTRGTQAAHVARAAIEAIAFQIRDVFEAMEADTGERFEALLADGGASRNDALMQFQADLLGRPVLRARSAELSAVGAAHLAGLAVGLWTSIEDLARLPRERDRFAPRMAAAERDRLISGWKSAVVRTLSTPSTSHRRDVS